MYKIKIYLILINLYVNINNTYSKQNSVESLDVTIICITLICV